MIALALATVVLALVVAGARGAGYRFYTVESPSMGSAMPVGTLALVAPVDSEGVDVGDVIAYRDSIGRTITHRVVGTGAEGMRTRGDLNDAEDPAPVTSAELIGVVVWSMRYLGWVASGLPWLLGGWLAVALVVRLAVAAGWWKRIEFLLDVFVIDIVLVILHPLLGARVLGFHETTRGMAVDVVSTGILPVAVRANGEWSGAIGLGDVGRAVATTVEADGFFHYYPEVAWSAPWLVGAVLVSLAPLLWALLVGFREIDEDEEGSPSRRAPSNADASHGGRRTSRGRWMRGGLAGALALCCAPLALVPSATPADATFTAEVRNPDDSLGIRTFFTCRDAMIGFNTAQPQGNLHGRLLVGFTMGAPLWVAGQTTADVTSYVKSTTSDGVEDGGCATDVQARGQTASAFDGVDDFIRYGEFTVGVARRYADPANTDYMTSQVWFRTTNADGGVLSCLQGGAGACLEAALYLGAGGTLNYESNGHVITAPGTYADGAWHFAVAQNSGTSGMKLWVDGRLAASDSTVLTAAAGTFYPQWGYSNGSQSWTNWPQAHMAFAGDLQMGAFYGRDAKFGEIGQAEVALLYQSAFL